ncbi:YbfB/YjiJ family MFS transporter [Rhizobium mesosinicum]|uniref:YbfB/YjiJ family MFS transporter n=1 Tax=Rhizobium mesosinicum TaxID=335017 RepID=A0ABS7GMU3_9HYPH|nr:YbfB/YjiJ family MFS transporter [Rhizobium mesosinicum]MBW9051042.1 YbfB/YjiJ family MFS transporter [Rhizobium mesosinicum]
MTVFLSFPASSRRRKGTLPSPILIAVAGAASLAVAMGIGRFAFTPLMPMMLHDGVLDIGGGSSLASSNYLGYLAGAMLCMGLPKVWSSTTLIRLSLLATILLTLAMAIPLQGLWLAFRFLAGAISAIAFVYTAGWSLTELSHREASHLGGIVFSGPGAGIALSGIVATSMIAAGWTSQLGWVGFALLAFVISGTVWPVFSVRTRGHAQPAVHREPVKQHPAEMMVFALAYGLAGFGYIITATFLPVMAHEELPPSIWLDMFWPIFGLAAVVGCFIATRVVSRFDPRLLLVGAYLLQALGVILVLPFQTVSGFAMSSLLVGLPFTAINFFAMKEVQRLRPHHVARFMGMLTALYSIGQIAGPPIVSQFLKATSTPIEGFDLALTVAACALALGAALYVFMFFAWPMGPNAPESKTPQIP